MNLRLLRGLAGATTLALLAGSILIAPAMGADTRVLWLGKPDLTVDAVAPFGIPDTNGILSPTTVSVPADGQGPYATKFDVQVLNGGGQNLANTVLVIEADVQNVASLTLDTFYDPDGGNDASFCSANGDTITCNYGSLAAGAHRTVAVIVNVSSAYSLPGTKPLFSANVTTNNENGSNTQTFDASSGIGATGFDVSALNADGLNSFVKPGQSKAFATSGVASGGGKLSTSVNFVANGLETVAISEGTSTVGLYACPVGLSCQATYSEVKVGDGAFAETPYFTWTLTAVVPKTYSVSQGFVAHFSSPTVNDWTLFFKSKSAYCGDDIAGKIDAQGHCINGAVSLTKFDKTQNLLVVQVIMDEQGGMKL